MVGVDVTEEGTLEDSVELREGFITKACKRVFQIEESARGKAQGQEQAWKQRREE